VINAYDKVSVFIRFFFLSSEMAGLLE